MTTTLLSLPTPSPSPFPFHQPPTSSFLDSDPNQTYSIPIDNLPNSYIWPEQDRPSCIHEDTHQCPSNIQIPIIDMDEGDTCSIIEKLTNACEKWGIFYVTNHGVPPNLINTMREKSTKLFSLPLDMKMRALRKDESFEGYGKPVIAKFFKKLMWVEGFTMMGHPSSSIVDTTNRICVGEDNEFRETFEDYDIAMKNLSGKLLSKILMGLGIDMEQFKSEQFIPEEDCYAALQLNHYPPCPNPLMTMGLPAHTDSTCLTILNQGEVTGLEIYKYGDWIRVPPLQGSLVIHVGDMLQILSNDKYKSVVHRAITNKTRPRLSIAYLCGPPLHKTINSPHEVVKSSFDQQPMYGPTKWIEFLHAKTIHFMGTLDYLKAKWHHSNYI